MVCSLLEAIKRRDRGDRKEILILCGLRGLCVSNFLLLKLRLHRVRFDRQIGEARLGGGGEFVPGVSFMTASRQAAASFVWPFFVHESARSR